MSDRIHPYDFAFGTPELEGIAFPMIKEEAEARGVDVRDQDRFIMLAQVGELMRALLPEAATTPAVAQFTDIVTQAYNYWNAGKQTFAIEEDALRQLLTNRPIGSWDMAPPAPAGYVQLPRNIIFARIAEGAHAESIDGFFFIMPGNERLAVLVVLGLVPNRGGFSIINVATPAADHAGHFGDIVARTTGDDFDNVLPGGEGRLFAVTSELEALKLVSRCFWHLTGNE